MSSRELLDTILDLEEETWEALQRSGAAMVPYITKDCIFQFPLGLKLTANSQPSVQEILHSPAFVPWKTFELSKVTVTPVGPEGAVIGYLAKATRAPDEPEGGEDVGFEALCTSVWRRESGAWKMCFHQQTLTQ